MGDTDAGYQVGYKRPPKQSQFKKGQSGNLAGAPKRTTVNIQSILEDTLSQPVFARTNGKSQKLTGLEAMLWGQLQAASRGNLTALREILRLAKRCNRLADAKDCVGVLVLNDPNSRPMKLLAEFRALKAKGIDPLSVSYWESQESKS